MGARAIIPDNSCACQPRHKIHPPIYLRSPPSTLVQPSGLLHIAPSAALYYAVQLVDCQSTSPRATAPSLASHPSARGIDTQTPREVPPGTTYRNKDITVLHRSPSPGDAAPSATALLAPPQHSTPPTMSSTAPRPTPPPRPVYAPLQSSANSSKNSSAFQSYSSSTLLAAPTPASSAPVPAAPSQPPQNFFGSLNGQPQAHQAQPEMPPMQRYRSFEFQPNRDGAGRTAGETQSFLNQTALLAEAAKRAQMACVMRDLDSMEL